MVRRVNIALFLSFIFLSNGYAGGLVITQMLGNPEIYKNGKNGAFPETVGAMLTPGKELIVAGKGSIDFQIGENGIQARAKANSNLKYLGKDNFSKSERLRLQNGLFQFHISNGSKLNLQTPHLKASTSSAVFSIQVINEMTCIFVSSGKLITISKSGKQRIVDQGLHVIALDDVIVIKK